MKKHHTVVTSTNNKTIITEQRRAPVVTAGVPGPAGLPGSLSMNQIQTIVRATVHADNPSTDGIAITGDGNIRLAIGTLQTIP